MATAKKKAMTDDELVRELREFHHYESARRFDQLRRAPAPSLSEERRADDEAIKDLVGETCRRTSLAIGVYDAMHDATESWEGEFGGDLAYLMGAILKGEKFEAWMGASDDLMRLLVEAFELDNAVWDYVDLMNDDGDVVFPARIKTGILKAAGAGGMEPGTLGNLDEEDYPQAGAWVDVLKVKP